ncbi:helicase [Fragilaria crotonensis]|nr:helicase [Fragilaria crotonensis]
MVDECRVFKEKLALFLEDLREGVFFEGRQLMYIVHAVEFQWRGHPHAHIVFRLEGDRLTPDEIDRMITTSYTQCKTEEEIDLLTTFMTHHCKPGLCLKEAKPCSQFFPKELSPSYQAGNRGYPTYRRLNKDDQFIVPCVLKMIAKFKCHINTEVCSDVFIFEYLFKYIYKGNVRLEVTNVSKYVDNEMDHRIPESIRQGIKDKMTNNFKAYEKNEINRFELMHCIPATQATWKFLGYHTMQNQPGVRVIDVELPGNEVVHFKPDDISSMQNTIANTVSAQDIYWNRPDGDVFNKLTLEKFFDLYVVERDPRLSTKHQIGEIFIPTDEELERKQTTHLYVYSRRVATSSLGQTINRMKFISPACGDLYYLRMLLRHYPSRSFVDARTVDGNVYDTCHGACVAMGIVSNENEFDVTMMEAISNRIFSSRLRHLFVIVVLQGHADPKTNFDKYALYMSFDFYDTRNIVVPIRQQGEHMSTSHSHFTFADMPYDIQQDLLQAIERLFLDNNLEMADYGIPSPKALIESELEREKKKYNFDVIRAKLDGIVLNPEQQQIIDYIINHTDNIFIDAPFGRGKSFLLDYVVDYIRVRHFQVVLVCAPTGVMAIARGGFTMHGLVKMNIEPDDAGRLQCHVGDHSQRAAFIRGAHYLIIEEGANASRQVWEAIEDTCRNIRGGNKLPFGGLRVITAGDFRQIPPPIKSHDERDVYHASVKSWSVFQSFTILHLTKPIRTANDPEWTTVCDNLGNGTTEPVVPDEDGRWTSVGLATWVDLPDTVKCYDAETQLNDARDWAHPDVKDYDAVIVSALVAVTNKQVDEHNNYFLSKRHRKSYCGVCRFSSGGYAYRCKMHHIRFYRYDDTQ